MGDLTKKKNQQYSHLLQPNHHQRRKSQERRLSLYLLLRNQLSPSQTRETCLKGIDMSATRKLKELKVELKAKFSFNTKEVAALCRSKSSIILLSCKQMTGKEWSQFSSMGQRGSSKDGRLWKITTRIRSSRKFLRST